MGLSAVATISDTLIAFCKSNSDIVLAIVDLVASLSTSLF